MIDTNPSSRFTMLPWLCLFFFRKIDRSVEQLMFPLLGPLKAFTELMHYICSLGSWFRWWPPPLVLELFCRKCPLETIAFTFVLPCPGDSPVAELFLAWTGHGDLRYLPTAKRLTPSQLKLLGPSSRFFLVVFLRLLL